MGFCFVVEFLKNRTHLSVYIPWMMSSVLALRRNEVVDKYEHKQWYAARVKPHTEKKIKNYFVESEVRHYIPFQTLMVERDGRRKSVEKPVITGLIFVYTEYASLLTLPQDSGFAMTFMRNLETGKFLVVPDKQMKDFMFVLDFSGSAIPISNENLHRGTRVRIIKGELAGVEGELVRVKGHKRVVIRLEGLFSLATTYVPKEYLESLSSSPDPSDRINKPIEQ